MEIVEKQFQHNLGDYTSDYDKVSLSRGRVVKEEPSLATVLVIVLAIVTLVNLAWHPRRGRGQPQYKLSDCARGIVA